MDIKAIAKIHNGFTEKFGIPRQSGLVDTTSKIVFTEEYRNPDSLRGLDGYSHLWIIWGFSLNERKKWSPTVRPPRLGGNKRMGVFATRSPNRPNPIGLSCVEIDKIVFEESRGMVIYVKGADLADGTPIYDIKPYLPFTDCRPEAVGGFADEKKAYKLLVKVDCSQNIPNDDLAVIKEIIKSDPRPAYQNDPKRIYKMTIEGYCVEFKVVSDTAVITKIENKICCIDKR